jgi:acyl dehydratase
MFGLAGNGTTSGASIGNLGMTDVLFPHPLYQGDSVRVETTIKDKRLSKSRPTAGIVTFEHRAYNQNDVLVAKCTRQAFMKTKDA